MPELPFLQYLTTGQLSSATSMLHRLDPRVRILGFGGLLVALVSVRRIDAALVALGAMVCLMIVSRLPLRSALRGLRALLPWLLLIVLIQIAFGVGDEPGCPLILDWGPLRYTGCTPTFAYITLEIPWCKLQVSACTLRFAAVTLLRFVGLMLLLEMWAWMTSIPDLIHGLEGLFRPLERLGLPLHGLMMASTIAVRFLPTMALETERLLKAQAARGGDLDRERAGLLARVRAVLPLVVPVFVTALRRAERLAEAMEARAYGASRQRGVYVRLKIRWSDGLALALALALIGLIFFVNT
jgi:energy-coupling factor transport system permease protein